MRVLILAAVLATGLCGLAGCGAGTSDPYDPAIEALNNPANACGPGGTSNVNVCQNGKYR